MCTLDTFRMLFLRCQINQFCSSLYQLRLGLLLLLGRHSLCKMAKRCFYRWLTALGFFCWGAVESRFSQLVCSMKLMGTSLMEEHFLSRSGGGLFQTSISSTQLSISFSSINFSFLFCCGSPDPRRSTQMFFSPARVYWTEPIRDWVLLDLLLECICDKLLISSLLLRAILLSLMPCEFILSFDRFDLTLRRGKNFWTAKVQDLSEILLPVMKAAKSRQSWHSVVLKSNKVRISSVQQATKTLILQKRDCFLNLEEIE